MIIQSFNAFHKEVAPYETYQVLLLHFIQKYLLQSFELLQ